MNEKTRETKGTKVSWFKKLGFKLGCMACGISVVSAVICMLVIVPNSTKIVTDMTKKEMQSLVNAYEGQVEDGIRNEAIVPYSMYKEIMGDMKIEGGRIFICVFNRCHWYHEVSSGRSKSK